MFFLLPSSLERTLRLFHKDGGGVSIPEGTHILNQRTRKEPRYPTPTSDRIWIMSLYFHSLFLLLFKLYKVFPFV